LGQQADVTLQHFFLVCSAVSKVQSIVVSDIISIFALMIFKRGCAFGRGQPYDSTSITAQFATKLSRNN
jgi:hypothetical protein